ncbi:MAG: lyase family protein [Chloroflexota bacterium]
MADHLTDIAAALISLGINLSRMTKDMLFWATQESNAIRIDDSFIQISSIMPQKRNPVVLEHLRARLSRLLGQAQSVVTQCHNIPYGDTQDIEDEILPSLFNALATVIEIVELYEAVFATLTLNVEHLQAQAAAGFTTVTELADTLVREAKLPFRTAHHIVAQLVQHMTREGLTPDDVDLDLLNEIAQPIVNKPLSLTQEALNQALDPVAFVQVRNTLGGASPSATAQVLRGLQDSFQIHDNWLQAEQNRLTVAEANLQQASQAFL